MTSSSRKARRLLGSDDIEAGLAELAAISSKSRVEIMLVGGVALHFYGSERLTADLDVVAQAPLPSGLVDEGRLTFGGTKTRTPGGIPVDWIDRDDDCAEVYAEALQYRRVIEGVPLPLASPEYLAAMKMIAGRDRDEIDLIALLQSGEVDVPKARRMIKRLLGAYAAQDFDGRVEEAAWRASRKRS